MKEKTNRELYASDEEAMAATAHCALHYALQGFLTSVYMSKQCNSYDVTVHHDGVHVPQMSLFPLATSYKYKHWKNSNDENDDVYTLELWFDVQDNVKEQ